MVITDADRRALDAGARREILLALAAQAFFGLAAAAVAGILAGVAAGLSALMGAAAYWLPNALFALRLLISAARSAQVHPYAFLVGESTKLILVLLLLGLSVGLARSWLVLPAMLAGLFFAMKGHLPLLLLRKPFGHSFNKEQG